MNHFFNAVIAAATVGAIASVDKVDIVSIDANIDVEDDVKEANNVFNSALVRGVFVQDFNRLIHSIHKEDLRLSEIYASAPQVSGSNSALLGDYSRGTQNVGVGASVSTSTSANAICHTQCHTQCHNNHDSRSWR